MRPISSSSASKSRSACAELAGGALLRLGGQRALPAALERLRIASGALDVGLQFRRVHAGIEIGEVPFRQVAERGLGLPGRRGAGFRCC